ncbi:hypothetical protein BN8_03188 [Fibrisoma limi BUZ 3]|uniref:Uncharacterized protein n=1 Tax=Fibrisoma limi BUZ 3 TaxID=1185876 RepID=I2GJH3_9BACT|nr:hypothetical protein BN8_03188 [Fibrisoma limi BUZ 3]
MAFRQQSNTTFTVQMRVPEGVKRNKYEKNRNQIADPSFIIRVDVG